MTEKDNAEAQRTLRKRGETVVGKMIAQVGNEIGRTRWAFLDGKSGSWAAALQNELVG
jgi:hypothetical protein